ncbi:ABC transporter substrate-binding protein [Devosia salina]|uniref:ABC transporter substrate-binding protein n=1 Tax=Devosia salina TaxID=2860336 RepID=A0ABX8WBM0_9HYPH|nr:ABC transporter substrate-binding protein [Devosia salina]QYO75525.1 ABC transporter substrate-binding protein [Devosia salina]
MLKSILGGVTAALMLSSAASATDLIIYHNWSSGPEVAALNVLKAGLEAKGHTWTDIAIPHDTGSNVNLMNLVTGGTPPNVFLESSPGVYRDLIGLGLGRPLTEFFTEQGILEHYPTSVVSSITVDGEIMKIPTAIHIDGMAYYNMDVAKAAGVDPASWNSLDAMFADFQKIRDAGYIPIAIGGQQWQVGYLTHALAAATGGPEFYNGLYGAEPDPSVIDSADMRTLLETLRRFQQEADEGSVNREWNVTTNMVITGKALMQIHGDWMKGEWTAAGKVAGTDFGCVQIPGAKAVPVTVDSWGILGGQPADVDAAELDFAAVVADPQIQADFSAAKGSTPTRLDAPAEVLDACSTEVLHILEDADHQVPNPHSTVDADWQNSIWDVVFNFWSDPSMSVDDAIAQIQENYDIILG